MDHLLSMKSMLDLMLFVVCLFVFGNLSELKLYNTSSQAVVFYMGLPKCPKINLKGE